MYKCYCDRCGKTIEMHGTLLRHTVIYGKTKLTSERDADDFWHDICKNCEDSFVAWFNHPEKDGVPNA